MLLKKQTVWLLTMLSLVVVLSVYYVTTPTEKQNNMATSVEKEDETNKAQETTNNSANGEEDASVDKAANDSKGETPVAQEDEGAKSTTKEVIPSVDDESFQTARLEITDERNRTISDLTEMMGNTELSAEERADAVQTIEEIRGLTVKETMLETLIKQMDYDAALVRADKNEVRVTVKAEELSKSAANDIIRMVASELPTAHDVKVEFQPKQ